MFSQSSPSTNVGDLDDIMLSDTENKNPPNANPPPLTYQLRSRTVTKKGTINGQKRRRRKTPKNDNDDMETCSQESVSLLQGCYTGNDFPETCIESNLDWGRETMDSCTQTELPLLGGEREWEITKHTKFVGCVVRLKSILSSKDKMADEKLMDVLRTITDGVGVGVSRETLGYVLRSSDTENVFRETVQTLLSHLGDILEEDFVQVAARWRFSVYEMAVDMLNIAVDYDPGIRKMVEVFLRGVLDAITNDQRSKNLVQESKTMLVMTFCGSTYLSFTFVRYIIVQLKCLKTKPPDGSSMAEKIHQSKLVKNSYLLLRILEGSLVSIRSKVKDLDKILNKKEEVKNFNVLEMWKKHWRTNEGSDVKRGCQWRDAINEWCDELDEVLVNCVTHFPISAMAVERCKGLVTDILKNSNPEAEKNECVLEF